jgi:hypothetical protein
MKKTYTTALVLGLALALLVTFSPVLAHPIWEGEDGEQIIPPWMGDYENMPNWGDNETFLMPHWYNNGTLPEDYYNEDGTFCPGPYWGNPEVGEAEPAYPRGGYGCGMGGGRGYRGGSRYTPRGPTGWSG